MKLASLYEEQILSVKVNEELCRINESYRNDENLLTEGIGGMLKSMLESTQKFFTKRDVDKVGGLILENKAEGTTAIIIFVDNNYEATLIEGKTVVDRMKLNGKSEAEQLAKDLQSEGMKIVKGDKNWRKIIKMALIGIGLTLLVGGTLYFMGPALIVFGGWLFNVIGTVAGWALWAGSGIASGAMSAAGWAWGAVAGAGTGAGTGAVTGAAISTAKTVAITGISAYAGWKVLKFATNIDDRPDYARQ